MEGSCAECAFTFRTCMYPVIYQVNGQVYPLPIFPISRSIDAELEGVVVKSNRRKERRVMRFSWVFSLSLLSCLTSCSVDASLEESSLPQETVNATPEDSLPTDGAYARGALAGDARLEGKTFFLYTGRVWQEIDIPSNFTLGFSEKNGKQFTSLTSSTNPSISILFSMLPDIEEVPDIAALRNQLMADNPKADVKKRGDIGNWGDAPAVAAQVSMGEENVGIVAVAKIDGYIWSVTVNAQNEWQANELYDSVQSMSPSEQDSTEPMEEQSPSSAPSLDVALSDETLVVGIGQESLILSVPESFTAFEDKEAGIVGGGDTKDTQRSIVFTVDKKVQGINSSKIMAQIRESSVGAKAAELTTVPSVSSVAGREAAAVDMVLENGARSRIYIVHFKTSYIQIIVNEPTGDKEALERLTEMIRDAR